MAYMGHSDSLPVYFIILLKPSCFGPVDGGHKGC